MNQMFNPPPPSSTFMSVTIIYKNVTDNSNEDVLQNTC